MSKEDEECENHFKQTFQNYTSGRYIVRLLFKIKPPQHNNSYNLAVQQLKKVEKSFLGVLHFINNIKILWTTTIISTYD